MRLGRRRWFAAAAAAALLAVLAIALAVAGDDGDDGNDIVAVATSSTTSTSLSASGDTSTTSGSVTTVTTTAPIPGASRVPVPTTATPTTATPTTAKQCLQPAPGSDFDGFGAAEIVIQNSGGPHRSCVLTADTPAQQWQGLMGQADLDGYDGMIFRFATAEERSFWMRNTQMPLSIAYFDAGGTFVSATDMEPCGDSDDCPRYPSHGAAKFALEVPKGGLPAVGATPGSRLLA